MTGWGQDGPLANVAGHDINYIALAGARLYRDQEEARPPLNLVGDFGGMMLAFGMVCGLLRLNRLAKGRSLMLQCWRVPRY